MNVIHKHRTSTDPSTKTLKKTYGNHELGGLELPEGDIDRDTTLTLSLELVEHPGCNDAALRFKRGMSAYWYSPYLKEPFPSSAASFSNFSMVRLSIPPHL